LTYLGGCQQKLAADCCNAKKTSYRCGQRKLIRKAGELHFYSMILPT